ncbi:serpin family protein [Natronobeatus ordinarius]|uniref:serpin family protein n=1 Tax=Natronobeatus ordinarius TaxID=2963433 RepID=UPI0020CB6E51|nr:serpin family protein [Natronobeatus ordinarius]
MTLDRRTVLALSGALVAGAAGCLGSGDDDGSNDDDTGSGADDGTGRQPDDGFDGYDVPEFPQLDLVTDPDVDEAALAAQVRGNVAFTLALLERLREEEPAENLFVSPYSVSVALAMTYAGARGETAEGMADALRFELEGEELHAAFGALEDEFARRNEDGEEVEQPFDDAGDENDGPAFQLNTANALWGQEGYGFREAFLELLEAYYGAGMQLVDFAGDAEAAREEINAWVEAETNDRIEDLLQEGDVSDLTRLVLTNAIYFLAPWRHDFDPAETAPGPFTGLDGEETEVDLMHQTAELRYAEVEGHQLVELPYANRDTSMVVILPAEGEFEAFEERFSVDRLAIMLEEMSQPEVDLTFPKFGIESRFSLLEVMADLGMPLAGDFSGMDDEGGLEIGEIVHQSFVEVDEEGTEAAAATAVVMDESAPADHVEMVVDRPFLFYIRDRPTETPLFWGRVVDGETLQEE